MSLDASINLIDDADVPQLQHMKNENHSSMGGVELLNLFPGSYELQVMAVSLAGNSSWTEPVVFEVELLPQSLAYGRPIFFGVNLMISPANYTI